MDLIFRQFRNFVIIRKRASTKLVMLKTAKHLWRNVHRRVRIWPIKAYFFARWRFLKDYVYGHFCSLNSSDEWLRKNSPIHWLYIFPWKGVKSLWLKGDFAPTKPAAKEFLMLHHCMMLLHCRCVLSKYIFNEYCSGKRNSFDIAISGVSSSV